MNAETLTAIRAIYAEATTKLSDLDLKMVSGKITVELYGILNDAIEAEKNASIEKAKQGTHVTQGITGEA